MFTIKYMGCDYRHDKDFYTERQLGYDFYLALFIKSRCVIGVSENVTEYEPDTFVLFNKNSPQFYGACGEDYTDDWIVFSADESFISGLNIEFGKPVHIGKRFDLGSYFRIIQSYFFRCNNSNATLYHIMSAMFMEISECIENTDTAVPHISKLRELRIRIYYEPQLDWNISCMAEELHVSEPYIQEIYRRAFGVSCMSDVIHSRINKAKNLLAGTDKNIDEICTECGYNSSVHFSRQFKQQTGYAPSVWRKIKSITK
ncbi:MAG: helix-turn-helix transcriptional regulator [Ruminococcus sp.]|nr:helix-turn-helix transcriptional regulator [Ruminococcus sp.]